MPWAASPDFSFFLPPGLSRGTTWHCDAVLDKADDSWTQFILPIKETAMKNFYLGADVSKGYSDFMLLDAKKRRIEEDFQLDDTFDGHQKLYQLLSCLCEQHPDAQIYAAAESTGGYENNWFNALVKFQSSLPLKTARLNPRGVHNNSKAGLERNVTDPISAENVAKYMIEHPENVTYQQQDPLASLRKQWSFVKMLSKQKTQLFNQLESNLYAANPEILAYCKDSVPNWVLSVLARFPTAVKIAKAKKSSLALIPYVTEQKAHKLIQSAKKSVASATDQITAQIIKATVKQIRQLTKAIEAQEKILTQTCSVPEVQLLKTFPGISDISAIGLMLEIGSVERFVTAKKLTSFFGLHPIYKQSGDGSWGFHMSKKGRIVPRQILYMVAMAALQCNPLIAEIYLKHTEKGMKKKAALGLCMHKICRIIYGMLKHNCAFDASIDHNNRKKSLTRNTKTRKDKRRRYQSFDVNAPVSSRQNKKRKERKQSQSDNIAHNGIIEASVPRS
jgi:transposase